MAGFVLRRLLSLVPLLLMLSVIVFSLVYVVPGDPATTLAGGESATPERVEQIRDQLGLNDSIGEQYLRWLGNAVQFDFGESLYTGRSVGEELSDRLPVTASLILVSVVFALLMAIPLGIMGGLRSGSKFDHLTLAVTSLGIAIPGFLLAIFLIVFLGLKVSWFPVRGYVPLAESPRQWFHHLVLPGVALAVSMGASLARQLRGSVADVLQSDYIRTAQSKGLGPTRVIGKHALKNAAVPPLTLLGIQIGYMFGGTVIVEKIFGIPGLGTYMVDAIIGQDIPIIQGGIMMLAILVLITNLAVDLSYGFLNPKMRIN